MHKCKYMTTQRFKYTRNKMEKLEHIGNDEKKNAKKGILTQAGECRYRNLMLGAHFNTL